MKKIKPYSRNVYYYETDKMKIMHHSNYIRILEESRIWFLQEAGLPFDKIEELGIMMPVLSVGCRYLKPLAFGDSFVVYPFIERFTGTKLELSYRIVNKNTGELNAEGCSSHCFTDNALKPLRTKQNFPEVYRIFKEYEKIRCIGDYEKEDVQ